MPENILVVWVGEDVDERNPYCREILKELFEIVDHLILLSNVDMCVRLVQEAYREKLIIITSVCFADQLAPQVDAAVQVASIYILSDTQAGSVPWTHSWSKIRGIHDNIRDICEAIQQLIKQFIESTLPISCVDFPQTDSKLDLNQLEPSFMYTRLLKEILLSTDHEPRAHEHLMEYFQKMYDETRNPPKDIPEFIQDYRADTAIWWYTRGSFIYETLNQGLRLLDTEILLPMGLFIYDLHQQIHQLHQEQLRGYHGTPFYVSRGQQVSNSDYEKIVNRPGGLIAFNCFLSTSRDEQTSTGFALSSGNKPDMKQILFKIQIDPTIQNTPFADIRRHSYYKHENETLFSMNTVFRIEHVQPYGDYLEVKLLLTPDNDPQLSILHDAMRDDLSGTTRVERITRLLLSLGDGSVAEKYYLTCSGSSSLTTTDIESGNLRGIMKIHKGDLNSAIRYFSRSLDLHRRTLTDNDPRLATSHNNIGNVYSDMGKYTAALSHYNKALDIRRTALPENHPDLAQSYNDIAALYSDMGDYTTALSHYNKALDMQRTALPANHPDLATSYNNIAGVYYDIGDYTTALSHYKKALDMQRTALPANHPDLAASYNNIARVYYHIGDYTTALSHYNKALYI